MGSVGTPEKCQLVTFPDISPLSQPAPKGSPIQCFIRRDKATSTYYLYLGLGPAEVSSKPCKPLLVAKRIIRLTRIEFMIYSSDGVSSQLSDKLIGMMRSNLLGKKLSIFESRILERQSSHDKEFVNNKVGNISYIKQVRKPRQMECIVHKTPIHIQSTNDTTVILRNKIPMWHTKLHVWCLNFKGRVTVASVKNFQLLESRKDSQNSIEKGEQDKIILQFGKTGKDIFTMDYCYPLSCLQAFAISLSSFNHIILL